MTSATLHGHPEELPRREPVVTPLPDWSDPSSVKTWISRPVPVSSLESPFWSRDVATIERLHAWMVSHSWGQPHA